MPGKSIVINMAPADIRKEGSAYDLTIAVGILAAQSLVQPIVQAVLKSQHSVGKKTDNSASMSLTSLCGLKISTRAINVHLFNHSPNKLKELSDKHIETKLKDVLSSTFGDNKFCPITVDAEYSRTPGFTYIHMDEGFIPPGKSIYRFSVDKYKLKDSGMNMVYIIRALAMIDELVVIIHPLSEYTFDLYPGQMSLDSFKNLIKDLINIKLKGIDGLEIINEKKLHVNEVVKFSHYEEETDTTTLYLLPECLPFFPMNEIQRRILIDKKERIQSIPSVNAVASNDGNQAILLEDNTSLRTKKGLFSLKYKGKVQLSDEMYHYYVFYGQMKMNSIIKSVENLNNDYLISNDKKHILRFKQFEGVKIVSPEEFLKIWI